MDQAEAVRTLVESVLVAEGLELYDVEYSGGRLLVTVDRDGGIDLESLTKANHLVSELLDEHDPIPDDRFLLEVSSPGLERQLRTPAHFARSIGETVSIKRRAAADGERRHEGVLEVADDDGITVNGNRFAYEDIERARTMFAWGPTPKPKGGSPAKPHPKNKNAKADAS